jgi:DNA-directed RNA polymerase specialized sigma24 family protein
MANTELHEVVQQALDRLPRQMRAAVMLRYYDDMSELEVARVLGISVGTVKSTVARAVAKLRVDSELEQSRDSWLPEGYATGGRRGTITGKGTCTRR